MTSILTCYQGMFYFKQLYFQKSFEYSRTSLETGFHVITVKRPQGQKDESKREKERVKTEQGRKTGKGGREYAACRGSGWELPSPPPTSTHRRGVITTGHLYTW